MALSRRCSASSRVAALGSAISLLPPQAAIAAQIAATGSSRARDIALDLVDFFISRSFKKLGQIRSNAGIAALTQALLQCWAGGPTLVGGPQLAFPLHCDSAWPDGGLGVVRQGLGAKAIGASHGPCKASCCRVTQAAQSPVAWRTTSEPPKSGGCAA